MKKVLYAMPISAIQKEALSALTGLSFIFAIFKLSADLGSSVPEMVQ